MEQFSDVILLELARILTSPSFRNAQSLSRLLRFLVERTLIGDVDQLKESVLGVEVFGRAPSYDVQSDPIVRVTVRRLRLKLSEYYATEGARSAVRIDLPAGGYVPRFSGSGVAYGGPLQQQEALHRSGGTILVLAPAGQNVFDQFRQANTYAAGTRGGSEQSYAHAHPAFSPDGNAIAFDWKGPDDAVDGIYVQSLDAEGPACLSRSGVREVRPAWRPDGSRVAYLRETAEGRFEVRCTPVLGVGDRLIAETWVGAADPPRVDWYPDGRLLVTAERQTQGHPLRLALIAVGDGDRQPITTPPTEIVGDDEAVFSPRGDLLAFRRSVSIGVEDVYVLSLRSRYEICRVTHDNCRIYGFSWDSNGESIVISSLRDGKYPGVWRVPLAGGSTTRLTEASECAVWPSLCARGGRLAYVRQTPSAPNSPGGQIVIMAGV
ncbi:MAG: hypothetical protein ABFD60_03560 [Bryobacteraceae bacterium]